MSHPAFILVASAALAAALAAIEDRSPRERAYVATRVFLCCLFAVFAGGWVMRLIHG